MILFINTVFKNEATSNIKFYQLLSSVGFQTDGLCVRDGLSSSDVGIVSLPLSNDALGCIHKRHFFIDSYGCPPS